MSKRLQDISSFLARAKELNCGRGLCAYSEKEISELSVHGLTVEDAKDEMLGLMAVDYFKGPKQDFDRSQLGVIWEFKKTVKIEKKRVSLNFGEGSHLGV